MLLILKKHLEEVAKIVICQNSSARNYPGEALVNSSGTE